MHAMHVYAHIGNEPLALSQKPLYPSIALSLVAHSSFFYFLLVPLACPLSFVPFCSRKIQVLHVHARLLQPSMLKTFSAGSEVAFISSLSTPFSSKPASICFRTRSGEGNENPLMGLLSTVDSVGVPMYCISNRFLLHCLRTEAILSQRKTFDENIKKRQ